MFLREGNTRVDQIGQCPTSMSTSQYSQLSTMVANTAAPAWSIQVRIPNCCPPEQSSLHREAQDAGITTTHVPTNLMKVGQIFGLEVMFFLHGPTIFMYNALLPISDIRRAGYYE